MIFLKIRNGPLLVNPLAKSDEKNLDLHTISL